MNYRRFLIRLLTFLGGIYYFLYFVLPDRIGGSPDPSDPTSIVGGLRLADYQEHVANGFIVLGSMALGLGLINIVMVHGSKVVFLRKGWPVSVSLLVGFLLMVAITFVDWSATQAISKRSEDSAMLKAFVERIELDHASNTPGVPALEVRLKKFVEAASQQLSLITAEAHQVEQTYVPPPDEVTQRLFSKSLTEEKVIIEKASQQLSQFGAGPYTTEAFVSAKQLADSLALLGISHRQLLTFVYERSTTRAVFTLFFDGLYVSLGAAMFSLLGFYIAAAAYRAFRVKSVESALMIAAAFLVMLGQIPFGLWLWEDFPELRQWLLQVPNAAASRAIEMGAAIAGLIMAFRMWLTIEAESYK